MADSASISNKCTNTVSVKVEINGKEVTSNQGGLISLVVTKGINKLPSASLIFSKKCHDKKSASDDFPLGGKITIKIGYDLKPDVIFKGLIIRQSGQLMTNKPGIIELECKDPCIHLTLKNNSHNHPIGNEDNDTDIAKSILNGYKSEGIEVGDFPKLEKRNQENRIQHETSDWDFLGLLAEANQCRFVIDEGKYSWIDTKISKKSSFTATMNLNIIEIQTDNDARKGTVDIHVKYWDSVKQQLITEIVQEKKGEKKSGFTLTENVTMNGFDTFAAKEIANKMASDNIQSVIRARVKVKGVDLAPGQYLTLQEVNPELDKDHFISAVTHQVNNGSWTTDIQIGLDKEPYSDKIKKEVPVTPEGNPAMKGLQIGVVTALEKDQQAGDHRIKVRIPQVTRPDKGEDSGFWVRLSSLYAGNQRGFVFRPEIGDEVVLGFINEDPGNPVLLGSLHSNKNPAPYPATDKNLQKGFKAKGEMELIFDDDKKSVEIKTKKGLSILMDESTEKIVLKDNHKNMITMSSSGIEMKSDGTITIEGKQVQIKGSRIDLG